MNKLPLTSYQCVFVSHCNITVLYIDLLYFQLEGKVSLVPKEENTVMLNISKYGVKITHRNKKVRSRPADIKNIKL